MKFRARMVEMMAIRKFHTVLTTMGKLSKICVLRLTKKKVYFIVADGASPSSSAPSSSSSSPPSVWCELDPQHFFSEFNLEGVTKDDDEIYMELEPEVLARNLIVLKSGHNAVNPAKSLKVKLTRKHETPCLSFEIELCSFTAPDGGNRICTHDFPVTLIPRKHWPLYKEPSVSGFDVSLYLPDLRQLRHIAEKYKSLGNQVTLEASRGGDLKFSLDNERVNLATYFKNLEVPGMMKAKAGNDPDLTSRVRVDLKKLSLFLSADSGNSKRILANFIHEKMIHFFLLHDDLCTQYLIPTVLE